MHARNTWSACPTQEELAELMTEPVERKNPKNPKEVTVELVVPNVRSVQRWLCDLRDSGWLSWRKTLVGNDYTLHDKSAQKSDATPESPSHATPESPPTATPGSEPHATLVSPDTTPESPSSMIHAEFDHADSSSSEHVIVDDGPTRTEAFLIECGANPKSAQEFAGLDLAAAEAFVEKRLGHYPRAEWPRHMGLVITGMRRLGVAHINTEYAREKDPWAGYGDLIRRGDDISDLVGYGDVQEPPGEAQGAPGGP